MPETRAAHRYAQAIFEVAEAAHILEAVGRDFDFIDRMLRASKEFALFLKSPVINLHKKQAVLDTLFRGKVHQATADFLRLLAAKTREGLLEDIVREFRRLRDRHAGVVNVTALSATDLTPDQQHHLVRRIEAATRQNVRISFGIDPSLIGGFVVRFDDTIWDASVRHELDSLRRRLIEGQQ